MGQQLVFWQGADGDIWETWHDPGKWQGPLDLSSRLAGTGSAQPAGPPTLTTSADGSRQLVFWKDHAGQLWEAWYDGAWLGPWNWSLAIANPDVGALSSAPAAVAVGGQQLVFWQGQDGDLWEAWQNPSS